MGDDASGGGFNPCECIWNHEMAMRRLLNVLRNSQSVCTDSECFEPGINPPGSTADSDNLYLMTFIIGISLLLFFFRPRMQANESLGKPTNNNTNNTPPAPPID